jgi:hypothetical protein
MMKNLGTYCESFLFGGFVSLSVRLYGDIRTNVGKERAACIGLLSKADKLIASLVCYLTVNYADT